MKLVRIHNIKRLRQKEIQNSSLSILAKPEGCDLRPFDWIGKSDYIVVHLTAEEIESIYTKVQKARKEGQSVYEGFTDPRPQ